MLPDGDKTKEQLSAELAALRLRIAEIEQIEAGHKRADDKLPRYDHIDGLVGERTAELKALNWHLQQQITERKKAEEALERASKDLQLVSLVNNAANQGSSLPKILQLVVQETGKIFSCSGATFYAISEDKKYLVIQNLTLPQKVSSQVERLIGMKIPAVRIRLDEGSLFFSALQAGKPQLVNDPETIRGLMAECTENRLLKKLVPHIHQLLGTASVMQAPLISEGEVIGLLDISRKRLFTELELERFAAIAQQLIIVLKRKQAEDELRDATQKWMSLVEHTNDFVMIVDNKGGIHYINRAIPPHTADQVIGKTLYDFALPEYHEMIREALAKVFETGEQVSCETSAKHPSGVISFETTMIPITDDGKVISAMSFNTNITERRQAEEALADEVNRRRILVEQSLDGIVVLDEDAEVYEANQRFAEMLGYTLEEVRELHTWDWDKNFPPEKLLEMGRNVDEAGLHLETQHHRKDGSVIDVEISISGSMIAGQKLIFCVCRDITERKKAEQALKAERNKLQSLIDAMEDGLSIQDKDFNIIYQNKPSQLLSGGDHVGKKCYKAYAYKDEVCDGCPVEQAFKDGKSHTAERKLVSPVGKVTFWETTANPIRDAEGKIISCLEIGRNITERKKAEEALRESEHYLRKAQQIAHFGSWVLDVKTNRIEFSDEIFNILGITKEQFDGTPEYAMNLVRPEDRARVQECYEDLLIRHKPASMEYLFIRPDGSVRHVWGNGDVELDEEGNLRRLVGTVLDITERKQAEERYRELAESITDVFFAFDKDLRYTYWNKASEELTGISAEDALGKHLYDLFPDNGMTKAVEKVYLEALRTQRAQSFVNEFQLGGRNYFFEINAYPSKSGLSVFVKDITERRQAEEKRQTILKTALDGFWLSDWEGRILEINDSYCRMVGYTREEMLKMSIPDIEVIENPEEIAQHIKKIAAQGHDRFETRHICKGGQIIDVEMSVNYLDVGGGQFCAFARDITERKRAEQAIQAEKNKLQSLIDAMEDGLNIMDKDYNIIYQNWPIIRQYGDRTGEKCYRVYEDGERVCDGCPVKKAFKDGKSHTSERKIIGPSGEVEFWENTANPIRNAQGEVVSCLEVTRDITERKRMGEALTESEEKYRGLVTNVRLGVFRSTPEPDGRFLEVNPAMEEITGYSREELLEMDVAGLYVNPEEREVILEEIASGKGRPTKEARLRKKDGTEIVVSDTKVAVRGDTGKVIYFDGIMEDITERKQAEEREKALQEELELASRLAAVGELAAGVAHEMNNPLTGILGFSERLSRKSTDDDTKESLELIHYEAQRLAKVVQNLLTFARRREPKKEYADINDILQKTLDLRAYELKTGNIEVVLEMAANLPQIMVDFHQIQEVFVNIILNAEQVMTEASGGGKLAIKTRQIKDYIRISFTDDGPGIPAEDLGKIFNPFFTTKGERGGTGLGLSVCHGIVTEHGGRIYARSRPGGGATFLVDLPLTNERTGESQIAKEQLAV